MNGAVDLQRVWEYKGRIINLLVEDIYYICCEHRKTYVHTKSSVYQIGTIVTVEEEALKSFPFVRIHNAYLVHLKHLECLGRQEAVLRNGVRIPVSERREGCAKEQMRVYLTAVRQTKKRGKTTINRCICPICLRWGERCDMFV